MLKCCTVIEYFMFAIEFMDILAQIDHLWSLIKV